MVQKKVKKTTDSINSRLQLVIKSGAYRPLADLRPHVRTSTA